MPGQFHGEGVAAVGIDRDALPARDLHHPGVAAGVARGFVPGDAVLVAEGFKQANAGRHSVLLLALLSLPSVGISRRARCPRQSHFCLSTASMSSSAGISFSFGSVMAALATALAAYSPLMALMVLMMCFVQVSPEFSAIPPSILRSPS